MDVQTYLVAKGILVVVIGISIFRKILRYTMGNGWKYEYFFPEIYPQLPLSRFWRASPTKKFILQFSVVMEILVLICLASEHTQTFGAGLYLAHLLVPSFLLTKIANCLKFNLFTRNLVLSLPGIILFFSYTQRSLDWMDYYSGSLFTAIVILSYSVGNWILHQYNQDIEDRVVRG